MTKKNYILSLGGGAFLNNKIRQFAQKKGETFYLNWDSKTLINRIKKNNKRPLASNLSNNELKELIINRSKIYLEAKHIINCENMKKTEIINKIIKNLKI